MKRVIVAVACLTAMTLQVGASEDLLDQDPDSLFTDSTGVAEDSAGGVKEPDLVDAVRGGTGITLGTQVHFLSGYSLGLAGYPRDESSLVCSDSAILDMASRIWLDCRISKNLRVMQKFWIDFPDLEPRLEELFADYAAADRLYLRVGRQNLSWGFSPNFPYTNLPARIPDEYADRVNDYPDSFSVKIDLPLGVGGVQALAYTRTGYWLNDAGDGLDDSPSLDQIGFGLKGNLALSGLDLTVGGYYLDRAGFRAFLSLVATHWDNLQLYSEGLFRFDRDALLSAFQEGFVQASGSAGFLLDFPPINLQINGEYFYDGETEDLLLKGTTYSLFLGNNLAFNIRWKAPRKIIQVFTQLRYTVEANSGVLTTAISIDVLPNATLVCALPCILGDSSGGYTKENPDPKGRPFYFALTLKINSKVEREIKP